jgi:hypothetical protein
MPTPQIPQRAIDASRRLAGPARVLSVTARLVMLVGGGAALVLALAVGARIGIVVGVVVGVVLAVPAVWLFHAASSLDDVATLPARLQAVRDGTPLVTVSRADLAPATIRRGGVVGAARTVVRTAREVGDAVGPAAAVVEVATPTFWIWTAIAAAAALVLGLVALVVAVVAIVGFAT